MGEAAYLSWIDAAGSESLVFDCVQDEQWTGGAQITEHPVETGPNITDNIRVTLRRVTLKVFATNQPIASNQWANALEEYQPLTIPSFSITPGSGVIDVAEWDSQLTVRVLAGTASGFLGAAIGGALGGSAVGGALGAVAGSALAGSLLEGRIVHDSVQTDAPRDLRRPQPTTVSVQTLVFDNPDDFVLRTIEQLERLLATGQTIDVHGTKTSCIGPPGIGGMAIEALTHVRQGSGATITIGLKEIRIVSTTTVPAPSPSLPDSAGHKSSGNQGTYDMSQDWAEDTALAAFPQGIHDGQADVAAVLE